MNVPSRPILLVSSATAFSLLGDQFLYTVLPSYHDSLSLLPIHVGILLSLNRWVRLLTNSIAERVYRRFAVAPVLAVAFALGAALTAVYGTVTLFPVLVGARLLWGLCWSFIRQAGIMTVVEGAVGSALGRMMGFYRGISRTGSLVGMLVGGILHDLVGWGPALIAFAVLSLTASPLGMLSRRGLPRMSGSARARVGYRENAGLMASGFIVGLVGAGMIMSTLGYLLEARVGGGVTVLGSPVGVATLTGVVLAFRWISDLVGGPALGALSDRIGRRRAAVLFFALGGVVLFFVASSGRVVVLSGGVILFFVCTTALDVVFPAEAGGRGPTATVGYVTAVDMGAAAGPLLAWTALQLRFPHEGVLVVGGLCYLAGAVAALRTFRGNE